MTAELPGLTFCLGKGVIGGNGSGPGEVVMSEFPHSLPENVDGDVVLEGQGDSFSSSST